MGLPRWKKSKKSYWSKGHRQANGRLFFFLEKARHVVTVRLENRKTVNKQPLIYWRNKKT